MGQASIIITGTQLDHAIRSGPGCSKRRWFNELVKGHFVNCSSGFNTQYSDIFC